MHMASEVKDIYALSERFWAGETSLEEEARLRAFFSSHIYPADLEETATYFRSVANGRTHALPSSFDEEIMDRIAPRKQSASWIRWSFRIAATIIFLIGLVSIARWAFSPSGQLQPAIVHTKPQVDSEVTKAYEQTRSALLLLSSKMNRATATTAHFIEYEPQKDSITQ
ncbi:MAG: hypothetical protein JNM00_15895 [Flavobacteriales bacterium]|nr:hypothetical protein [Flavobacteriales bacterium]